MPLYLGHRIKVVEAIDVIVNGVRSEGHAPPTIDFGREAIVLESDYEIDIGSGCVWSERRADGTRAHRAVVEYHGDYDEAVKLLSRGSARLLTGPIPVPKHGDAQRKRGPVFFAGPSKALERLGTAVKPPPSILRRDLASRVAELEAKLRPILVERTARKEREQTAVNALEGARAAFRKDPSDQNGEELVRAEASLRRARLLSSVPCDSTQLDQTLAAARDELTRLDATQLWLAGAHARPLTFEQLYAIVASGAAGEAWRARGERNESGFAVLAFDLPPMTQRDVLSRIRHRAIAHALPEGGWRIIVQLSRPATATEAGLLAAALGAKAFFEGVPFPARGTPVLNLTDDPLLDVDAMLAELEPVEAA